MEHGTAERAVREGVGGGIDMLLATANDDVALDVRIDG